MSNNNASEEPPQPPPRPRESSNVFMRNSASASVQYSVARSSVADSVTVYSGRPKAFRSRESTNTRVTTEFEEAPPRDAQDLTEYVNEIPGLPKKSLASLVQSSVYGPKNVDLVATGNEYHVKPKIRIAIALLIILVIGFGIGISVGKSSVSNDQVDDDNNGGNNIGGTNAPTGSPTLSEESSCLIGFDLAFFKCGSGNGNSFICVSEKQHMECDNAKNPVLGSNGGIALSLCPGTSLCICDPFFQQMGNNFDPCNASNANRCLNV